MFEDEKLVIKLIYFINIMDNQFLSTPLLKQKNKIGSARDMLQKDELIKGLELKNNKLRTEIIKIQNVIDESLKDEPQQKNKQRQSIMRSDQNQASVTQQLANAYKKIKLYEYQISKIEQSQVEMGSIHKVKQVEGIIKEKKAMTDKLRMKLQQQQKLINQNVKKLGNNNRQQEIEKKIKSLSDEIKFLRQKQKQQEAKDQIRQSNMKKQYQFIKRLENQLLEIGMSPMQMEDIKARAVKKFQPNQSNVTKNLKQQSGNEQAIEDRTIDNYKQVQSEIKLLQKMQTDYEKKMVEAEAEKDKAVKLNSDTRDRLLEIQDEIERLERQILVQKGKVIPSNLKPLKPLRSVSSQYVSSQKQKKMLAKNNSSLVKGAKGLAHILKHDEVGMTSEKGQRFTDRNILGKKNLNSKIVGFSVYMNNQTGAIGGIQATYHNKKGGQYVKKDRQTRQQQYRQQKISCGEGEWLKSITGTLSQQDKLESLYIITNKGQSKRFGQAKTTKKSFSFDIGPDQIPVCIFGSLLVFKQIGKPEYSIVEHFGIEINIQSSGKGENIHDVLDA